jgi:dephospho-CoA kinase
LAGTNSRLAENGKTRHAGCAIKGGWKESQMTEIDNILDPLIEAEIKEHQAALVRQMVAIGSIISFLLILLGLHQ